MKKYIIPACISMFIVFLLNSCAASVSYKSAAQSRPPKPEEYEIEVFHANETPSKKNTTLGLISVDDSGFTINCSYDVVLGKAKEKAREIGADAIKIVKIESPDLFSSCYRIKVLAIAYDN